MTDKLEIGAYEAKTHLPELLRKVRAGSHFTITQRGQPVADLAPTGSRELSQLRGAAAAGRMRQLMQHTSGPGARGVAMVDTKAMIVDGRD